MTDPKMFATIKLLALLGIVLLLWNIMPTPRWAASVEVASFRLSLTAEGSSVRLRTGAFDSGQFALSLFARGR